MRTVRLGTLGVLALAVAPGIAAPVRVEVDHDESFFAARTGTAGALGFLGHDHAILATRWEADICIDPASPSDVRARVRIPVAALRIDTREALDRVGLDHDVDAEQQRTLQAKMLGPSVLDAAKHSAIRLDVTSAERAGEGSGKITGTLELHGRRRDVSTAVHGVLTPRRVEARGELRIRQTDFRIAPESVAGVVNVADEMTILFALTGRITDEECP
jgi:polyisoprenoid-binding protein YceI